MGKKIQYIHLPDSYDYSAPDGSEIRLLLTFERGGLCHCTLPPGKISRAIKHKTVDEIWYFLSGKGEVARKIGTEWKIKAVEPGDCINIPVGTHFQFRNISTSEPLKFLISTMPKWPGDDDVKKVDGNW